MASPTRWTWVWVDSGSWWWTGSPGMLRFMGSRRVGHDWATELNWICWRNSVTLRPFHSSLEFTYLISLSPDLAPGGASGKEPTCQYRRLKRPGLIPGLRRSSGRRHGNPLQYSCLKNPLDWEAWWATVPRVTQVRHDWSDLACTHTSICSYGLTGSSASTLWA